MECIVLTEMKHPTKKKKPCTKLYCYCILGSLYEFPGMEIRKKTKSCL